MGGEDDTPDPVVTVLTTNTPTLDQGSGTPRSLTTTDTTPTFTGNATMSDGSVQAGIIILAKSVAGGRGGTSIIDQGSTTTDEDGNFSITLGPFQPNTGGFELRFFAATDASDSTTYSDHVSITTFIQSTVDSTPTADPTNLRQTSSVTVAKVTVSGNAEANSTVTMKKGSSTLATGTANANGIFTLTSNTALSNATHTLKFTAKAQGKEPSSEVTFSVTVDVPAPPAEETTVTDSGNDDNIVIGDEGSGATDAGGARFDPGINMTSTQFDTTPTFEGNIIDFQGQSFTAGTDIIVDIFKQGSRLSPTISRRVGVTKADANGDFELTLDPIEPDLIFQLSFTIVDTSTGAFTTFPFSNSNSHSGFEIKSA